MATGAPDTVDWVVDEQGRPLAQELYNRDTGAWSVKLRNGATWREEAELATNVERPAVALDAEVRQQPFAPRHRHVVRAHQAAAERARVRAAGWSGMGWRAPQWSQTSSVAPGS